MGELQPFEHHEALASWIERLANSQTGLSLGEWMVFLGALNAALLDAARTEGRGGEPVAWRYRQNASRDWAITQVKAWADEFAANNTGDLQPLYASPIREPEISREAVIEAIRQHVRTRYERREHHGAYHFSGLEAAADAILNLAPVGGRGEGWRPTHRHLKRGSDYQTLKPAILQTEAPLADGATLLVYRDEAGAWWARTPEEFNDGRFEPLPPPPQEQGAA